LGLEHRTRLDQGLALIVEGDRIGLGIGGGGSRGIGGRSSQGDQLSIAQPVPFEIGVAILFGNQLKLATCFRNGPFSSLTSALSARTRLPGTGLLSPHLTSGAKPNKAVSGPLGKGFEILLRNVAKIRWFHASWYRLFLLTKSIKFRELTVNRYRSKSKNLKSIIFV
jgi:hypothetical protein